MASTELLFSKKKAVFSSVSRMAWEIYKTRTTCRIKLQNLNEGYFESGIELNQIFKGLTIYRYGPNQLPQFEDNISKTITFLT
jgi:hypothetical protein